MPRAPFTEPAVERDPGRTSHLSFQEEPFRGPPPQARSTGPLGAIGRYPFVFLAIVLFCAGAGVAVGLKREPVYTAEARLNVGNVDVGSQSLPSYVVATQSLAASYSRAIDAQQVVHPVAAALRRSPADVVSHIAASPIPESSVIRVEATGASAGDAVDLVNASAQSLASYVRGLDPTARTSTTLLGQYRRAELDAASAQDQHRQVQRRYSANPSASLRAALRRASADLSTARLRVKALAQRYQDVQQNRPSDNFVQSLTTASSAASDKTSGLALRVLTGVVAGLLLGAAVVTGLQNRRRRRA